MGAIIGASIYGVLRAKNDQPYEVLQVLDSLPDGDPSAKLESNPFMVFGFGANSTVPGTRLYWCNTFGDVYYTDGVNVVLVPGGPGVLASDSYMLLYDSNANVLYFSWSTSIGGRPLFNVSTYDGSTWTTLTDTGAHGSDFGTMGLVPTTAVANPGVLLIGWQDDNIPLQFNNRVQRWDPGLVDWVDEIVLDSNNFPIFFVEFGATVICGIEALSLAPSPADALIMRRNTFGNWADITPGSWASEPSQRVAMGAGVYQGLLYVCFRTLDNVRREIWTYDGTTWTFALDLVPILVTPGGAFDGGYVISFTSIDAVLHCGMDWNYVGNQYLTFDGTTWALNVLPTNLQPPFVESSIQFFIQSPEGTINPPEGNASGEQAPKVRIVGYWDEPQFQAWGATTWTRSRGIWFAENSVDIGTQVWLGNTPNLIPFPGYVTNAQGFPEYQVGQIDVVDPFVLTGYPSNGKGVANLLLYNTRGFPATNPLSLLDCYTFRNPVVTLLTPDHGNNEGGNTVVATGEWLFANLIQPTTSPSNSANRVWVVWRIFVRNGSGTHADPYRTEEVDSRLITFIDSHTLSFPMTSFPGGDDPVCDVIFHPPGLAPFSFGVPVGIAARYRFPTSTLTYTFEEGFAIIGSLETVLGLGGPGADFDLRNMADASDGLDINTNTNTDTTPPDHVCIAPDPTAEDDANHGCT